MIYPDGKTYVYPELNDYEMDVPLSYINDYTGVSLEAEEVLNFR